DDSVACSCPRDGDRDIGRAVVALENESDRRLLRGVELVDDVAATLLGVLHVFEARNGAMQGEMQGFKDRALADAVGGVHGIDGIVLELQHERVTVIVDAAKAFNGGRGEKVPTHAAGPSGRPSSAASTA